MNTRLAACAAAWALLAAHAQAETTIIHAFTPVAYNDSVGRLLHGTNGAETGPFPVSDDSARSFASAPDLSAASAALGDWLGDPTHLNANWRVLPQAPKNWAIGTEVALVYTIETGGASQVRARFGVDNGISVWLDGQYLFGARNTGGAIFGEYEVALGDLSAGTHHLQLLLEDHGVATDFAVQVNAERFTPAVPEPASTALLLAGACAVWGARRRDGRAGRTGD
ncbi:PEP-CTERM sorting domain-containing protein [Aquabacterium parvum]|uniref:PEP-CTERM sorting domain-containing protein n=1 Tax=Aquabacterium parvum TaxID=70584 RepID=UPI000718D227|nr:PEP-CTERM sorting domain-containing protein [Aquabacterium parvum]MBU0915354.1 PEP-CTERM sorting domain-containing protein [Gammaproteobacteria bacterium]